MRVDPLFPSLESNYPLVVVIEDCYVPRIAQLVLDVAHENDNDDVCRLTWKLAIMRADADIGEFGLN